MVRLMEGELACIGFGAFRGDEARVVPNGWRLLGCSSVQPPIGHACSEAHMEAGCRVVHIRATNVLTRALVGAAHRSLQ